MFGLRIRLRRASARKAQEKTAPRDGSSTQSGETSQTLLLLGRNRCGLRRQRIAIRPKTAEQKLPILLLKDEDQERVRKFVHKSFRDSKLPNGVNDVSRCDSSNIIRGNLLGKGTFSSVYKIQTKKLLNKSWKRQETGQIQESSKSIRRRDETKERAWLSALNGLCNSVRFGSSTPKYAIKTINKNIQNAELLVWSAAYLVAETRMLSGIDHPHIIRFCGWGSSSSLPETSEDDEMEENETPMLQYGHFLIVERLKMILKKQLKEWELERRKIAGCFLAGKQYPEEAKIVGATSMNHKYRRNRQIDYLNRMYAARLEVAVQVSSAIVYLHERNILHRDIKPQNIGFDTDGNAKLFDFGIAKEIALSNKSTGDEVNERLYNRTALAGSRLYMSPENGLGRPYNAKTDVYSFSMVLWELMTLRKLPHRQYSSSKIEEKIWLGPDHERPPLVTCIDGNVIAKAVGDSKFLLELPVRNLLERCWSPAVYDRPTMKFVHQVLQNHLFES